MKITRISAMAAVMSIALALVVFARTGMAGESTGVSEKRDESLKVIKVLLPDGSPAISKNIMLIVDVNWEVGDEETMRPYCTAGIAGSKNMLRVVGVTRKVSEMERLGPYGPLSSDEKGFLPLPEEVLRAAEKQQSFRNVGNFYPRVIMYDQPSDSVVLKGGGFFSSKDIYLGLPKSVKLNKYRLDEEEKREFFGERGTSGGRP
ncbi:MAG: hypothetical protein EG828_06270 [Deltaproteobacteria bacterium]|nr:hypothetical protein [Deltaproteobacteria bacterium]